MNIGLTPADWFGLFIHFTALSLLAVGGVISTVADMQRYLVAEQGWLEPGVAITCDGMRTFSQALAKRCAQLPKA